MTARRVVDRHQGLVGVGTTTHDQIDRQFNSTFIVGSTASNNPPNSYLLVGGTGVQLSVEGKTIVLSSESGGFGPQGPTGAQGPQGPTGAQGLQGVTGPAGPSQLINYFSVDGGTPSSSPTGVFKIDFGAVL